MYYLIVERYENWVIDENNNFRSFGFSEYFMPSFSRMDAGDFLIFYVSSGISSFSDVRTIESNKIISPKQKIYDEPYPYAIKTNPYLTLDREKWIKAKSIVHKLNFLNGKHDIRQCFRNTYRKLDDEDGGFLVKYMSEISDS